MYFVLSILFCFLTNINTYIHTYIHLSMCHYAHAIASAVGKFMLWIYEQILVLTVISLFICAHKSSNRLTVAFGGFEEMNCENMKFGICIYIYKYICMLINQHFYAYTFHLIVCMYIHTYIQTIVLVFVYVFLFPCKRTSLPR